MTRHSSVVMRASSVKNVEGVETHSALNHENVEILYQGSLQKTHEIARFLRILSFAFVSLASCWAKFDLFNVCKFEILLPIRF